MNNSTLNKVLQFIAFILIQALVLNHINFLGYINPYLYILFILFFPIKTNRTLLIFLSFLLGLGIDLFSDSGGVHAAASVTIAYIRPIVLKFSFGMIYEHQTIRFNNTELSNRLIYFTILTVIHHLVLFSLEIFNISEIILILKKTLFSSIFTILMCFIISILFSRKPR